METIKIVMVTDKNYIMPTKVTISSILKSARKNTDFEVHIFCSKELSQISRKPLLDLEAQNENVNIIFNELDDLELKDKSTTAYIPIASYYRLFIPDIIDGDKCLFVDGDMLVTDDLTDAYHVDLEDYYVAGVLDMTIHKNMEKYKGYEKRLGISTMNGYINAGFLVFNLKKIREDGIDKEFISAISNGYKYMDQDIINKCCNGKIKYLPAEYNFFSSYYDDAIKKMPVVIHYAGGYKPWLYSRLKRSQVWLKAAKTALSEKEYNEMFLQMRDFEKKSDWTYILEKTEQREKVIIVGFSDIGRNVCGMLQRAKRNIVAFADNDRTKQGLEYQGIPVVAVEKAEQKYKDACWINTSQNAYKKINEQLYSLGVEKNNILRYIFKDEEYFNCLDSKYMEYERQMLEG